MPGGDGDRDRHSACSSGFLRCGSARTISPSPRSPRRRSCASRRRTLAASRAATRVSSATGPECYDDTWRDLSGTIEGWLESLGWSNPETPLPAPDRGLDHGRGRHARPPVPHADPVGPCPACDPRGRGRRARAWQEHPRVQAPVPGDLGGDSRDSRFLPCARPCHDPSDQLRAAVTFIGFAMLVLGGLASYWGVRSARSSCGRCSRGRASSTCRSAPSA